MLLVCIADACIGIPFQVSFDRSIWGCSPVSPVSQTQAAALLPSCSEVSGTTSITRSLYAHQVLRDTCMTSHLYNNKYLLTQTYNTVRIKSISEFEIISKSCRPLWALYLLRKFPRTTEVTEVLYDLHLSAITFLVHSNMFIFSARSSVSSDFCDFL